jgi:hypothetical protein
VRHAAYFHELDAWTEYWDVYHPETRGRYYFGDGLTETGLLTRFLPRETRPPAFQAWTRMALYDTNDDGFRFEVCQPQVAEAIREVDELVGRIFERHFGEASDRLVQADYLEAMHRFAIDDLPPANERAARIHDDDPRRLTAHRHTLDGDIMWFAWAVQLDAARLVLKDETVRARHQLLMAGIAAGCSANFAWRKHRRTRSEYDSTPQTAATLRGRGLTWANDYVAAAREMRALFRIREWGED